MLSGTVLKIISYACLAVSMVAIIVLFLSNGAFVPNPIDQSLCPPNVGVAPDGTCGIYDGQKPSLMFIGSAVVAGIGFISLCLSLFARD